MIVFFLLAHAMHATCDEKSDRLMQTTEPMMWKLFMPPEHCAELAKMAQTKGRPFGASVACHCDAMHDPLVIVRASRRWHVFLKTMFIARA